MIRNASNNPKSARNRRRKGAALVEYALLIGGIARSCLVAISILGHKTNDMIATVAATIPGAHPDDNGPILSGKLVETAANGPNGEIGLDVTKILAGNNTSRLGVNLGNTQLTSLVVEANP